MVTYNDVRCILAMPGVEIVTERLPDGRRAVTFNGPGPLDDFRVVSDADPVELHVAAVGLALVAHRAERRC